MAQSNPFLNKTSYRMVGASVYTSVTPSVNVALVGQGGGAKVGHGLQSGKHLRPCQQNSFLGGKKEGRTYPPYIWPHALMPSQQTETVVEHLLAVGLVEVEVNGGSVLTEVITVVGLVGLVRV